MNDNISRQKLYKAISDGDYTTGNIFKDMELQQFIKDQPPADQCVPLSEVYRVIAGHSNYHGDNILAALTCIAVGKEVKPVRPLPADVPDTNVGEWIPCSEREPEDPCVYTVEDSSPYTVKKFGKPQRYVWKVLPYSLEMYHRLVAWKPIDPEPYKGE